MEEQKNKRVLRVELDDAIKKVSITGKDSEENVVMRQELSEDELDLSTGGKSPFNCPKDYRRTCNDYSRIPPYAGCTVI